MNPNTVNNERIHESLLLHKQERKGSSSKQMQTNIRGATVRTSSREVKTSGSKFDVEHDIYIISNYVSVVK